MGLLLNADPSSSKALSPEFIHELDSEGELVRSFSVPYRFGNDVDVGLLFSEGRIECSEANGGRIWAAYSALGEIHALSPRGELQWIARLDDVSYPDVIQVPGASIGSDPTQTDLVETIIGINLIDPSVLVVQVQSTVRVSVDPPVRERAFRTYLLDPWTGGFLAGFEADYSVLGGGYGKAVLYREDPYPAVSIRPVR